MGKWSHLETALDAEGRPKYQELPLDQNPVRAERLRARIAELGTNFPAVQAAYDAAYRAKEAAEAVLKDAQFEADATEIALRFRMQDLGVDSVKIGGFSLTPSVEPYPTVDDRSTLIAHFIETQPASLTVNFNTLKAQVKSAIEGEGDMPPGVGVFLKRTFSRRKAT